LGDYVVSVNEREHLPKHQESPFDKGTEILKITMLSEELRGGHFARVGFFLSFFVAIFAGDFVLIGINDPIKVIVFVIILALGLGTDYKLMTAEAIHSRKQLSELSPLVRTVEAGKTVGDFNDLLEKFRKI
jgi:hypothetical protein